ncbi:MAG: Eco57I restriction-modification methylase domain-containing protein, partial [Rhodoferax sp.]
FNLAGRLPRKSNEKFRHGLSVLDPTCGSGAFLFAALGILKPLYDATLRTLQAVRTDTLIAGEKSSPEKWAEVDELLARFAAAGSERAQDYAVIKHIIVNNLYGVDIEKQATEIAKLRLFLKLVALLEPGDDIEPLPDIDFNIRHGNTLVGYATADETEKAVRGTVAGKLAAQGSLLGDDWDNIQIELIAVEQQYNNFQIQQVQRGGQISAEEKQALTATLAKLEDALNLHLAREYGVNTKRTKEFTAWKSSHQPFHWYVDFYPMMAGGGFDAVIGNPPYVQLSEVSDYGVSRYSCADCGNLYAVVLERCVALTKSAGRSGFIVPVSAISTDGYRSLQSIYAALRVHVSCFDDRPSRLFDGLEHIRLVIALAERTSAPQWLMTRYYKWTAEERSSLFNRMSYFSAPRSPIPNAIPKVGDMIESSILQKVRASGSPIASHLVRGSESSLS